MLSRLIAAFVVLVTFGNIAVAGIDDWDERQQTLSGGRPAAGPITFSASPVPTFPAPG